MCYSCTSTVLSLLFLISKLHNSQNQGLNSFSKYHSLTTTMLCRCNKANWLMQFMCQCISEKICQLYLRTCRRPWESTTSFNHRKVAPRFQIPTKITSDKVPTNLHQNLNSQRSCRPCLRYEKNVEIESYVNRIKTTQE